MPDYAFIFRFVGLSVFVHNLAKGFSFSSFSSVVRTNTDHFRSALPNKRVSAQIPTRAHSYFRSTARIKMSTFASANPHNFSWQQTMLRIKDPKVSVPFYEKNFDFKLIHKYDFPQWSFSLYFLAILPEGTECPTPGTPDSESFLWTMPGTCLELTYNYGSETDDTFKVNNGNVEPYRGFGHIAVMTQDVYAASAELEKDFGVKFQKRPDEGRMKGLAFALDPDGYWIEIVKGHTEAGTKCAGMKYTLAQTQFRVKDPKKALYFYRDLLGMKLIKSMHMGVGESWGFSNYFLAHLKPELGTPVEVADALPDPESPDAYNYIGKMYEPVIELCHNHGTENDPDFKYHNGNDQTEEGMLRGFGHVGFLVDDLDAACAFLESKGVQFKKKPSDGNMRGLAFAYDPDNYWVEIIQRNGLKLSEQSGSS